jgi:hypothetical protein
MISLEKGESDPVTTPDRVQIMKAEKHDDYRQSRVQIHDYRPRYLYHN